MSQHPQYAYKLLTSSDRALFEKLGQTSTAVDTADSYVHLSTKAQLAETAAKYFAGEVDCLLLEIDLSKRSDVKWEASRGGDLFPHLYGALCRGDSDRSWTLDIPESGAPNLPGDLK